MFVTRNLLHPQFSKHQTNALGTMGLSASAGIVRGSIVGIDRQGQPHYLSGPGPRYGKIVILIQRRSQAQAFFDLGYAQRQENEYTTQPLPDDDDLFADPPNPPVELHEPSNHCSPTWHDSQRLVGIVWTKQVYNREGGLGIAPQLCVSPPHRPMLRPPLQPVPRAPRLCRTADSFALQRQLWVNLQPCGPGADLHAVKDSDIMNTYCHYEYILSV